VNTPTETSSPGVKFEIGHVLFIDIVGYSKVLINEQSEQIQKLEEIESRFPGAGSKGFRDTR
jgi:hypothetical protein